MSVLSSSPLISIITPIYNAEEYIEKGINSVIGQTYQNWELLLIDDGSTDGSAAICDNAAAKDSRIKVIHKPNGGVSSARNMGLDNAKGDYIAWVDSDDFFAPNALERMLGAVQANNVPIAICNYTNISPNGKHSVRYTFLTEDRVFPRETVVGLVLGVAITPVVWTTLWERSLWEGIRFPEGKLFEDVQITYKVYEKASAAVFIAEPILFRVVHADSLSKIRNLKNRVEGSLCYITRFNDAVHRWPQYRKSMLVSSARIMLILRDNVMHTSRRLFSEYKTDIRTICSFYREHKNEILPADANIFFKLEFFLLTSGTRFGFFASKYLDFVLRKGRGYLKNLKTPDLPEI